jgi:uncharacterized protein (UPF0335 family)
MIGGSLQLRQFRRAMRDGASVEDAAELAGMSIGEARLHAKDDAKNPPPAEAYELLPTNGHNQPPETPMTEATDDRLRLLIERIERLTEERKGISDDIKDVFSEAKATGYDAKIMRRVIALRKMKADDRNEMAALLETYGAALGMDLQGSLF